MVDPVALSYLLDATGPVQVGDFEITAGNAVDALLHQVYLATRPGCPGRVLQAHRPDRVRQDHRGRGRPAGHPRGTGSRSVREPALGPQLRPAEQELLAGTESPASSVKDPTERPGRGLPQRHHRRRRCPTSCGPRSAWTRPRAAATCRCTASRNLPFRAPEDAGETLPDYVTGGGERLSSPGSSWSPCASTRPVEGEVDRSRSTARCSASLEPWCTTDGRSPTVYPFLGPGQTEEVGWTWPGGARVRTEATRSSASRPRRAWQRSSTVPTRPAELSLASSSS